MTYKELQTTLKEMKNQGLTTIALNATKEVLQAEYDRLTTVKQEDNEYRLNQLEKMVDIYQKNRSESLKNEEQEEAKYWDKKVQEYSEKIDKLTKNVEAINFENEKNTELKPLLEFAKVLYSNIKSGEVEDNILFNQVYSKLKAEVIKGEKLNLNLITKLFIDCQEITTKGTPINLIIRDSYMEYKSTLTTTQIVKLDNNKATRERYYQSYKFQAELSENEREVKKYISTYPIITTAQYHLKALKG